MQIVASRDGHRAILVEEIDPERYQARGNDGFYLMARVRLRPRDEDSYAQIYVTGTFKAVWNAPGQLLRWAKDFNDSLNDFALIAIAEYLDSSELPEHPSEDNVAFLVTVDSYIFDIFQREGSSDEQLALYVKARIYWAWRYNVSPTAFQAWEARRLAVELSDIHQAAFRHTGILWEKDSENSLYQALPPLIRHFESSARAMKSNHVIEPTKYDVALSFAGEQRQYVREVAKHLNDGGASVFYDADVDLWGKDLTLELEQVYRYNSRYVIVFVSKEYVGKAWPNLERQHALAGRIERMDDSVLPARFDDSVLPGLPTTVAYLDIRERTSQELANLILAKLARVGD